MSDGPLLEVADLRVTYGAARAVDDVSLHVDAGEIVTLLGPNGAGKSSILRSVSGLGHYDGTITFDGRSTRRRSVEALARSGLVHIPEGRRIFAPLTVTENLDVARAASGRRRDAWTVDAVFELFPPLAALRDRRGWMLSGGEQQMLAIGRALLAAPRLLLLDEPSLGLAPRFVEAVFEALVRISAKVPMLLVEQNTAVALDVAARGYVISSGRIVMEGSAAQLADHASVLDRYLGRTDATG